jgi:uncharacterized protein DUF1206
MFGVSISGADASDVARVAQNQLFERLARGGYVMNGILHVLIGYLAIRIAFGSGSDDADPSGALATVAHRQGGNVALWLATTAFLFMALWRLVETVLGRSTDPKPQAALAEGFDRVKALSLAVVYFAFAYSAYGFARGAGRSSAQQTSTISARLMQTGIGTAALFAAGAITVGVGVYHCHKGASRGFLDDLKGEPGALVTRLGIAGYLAKGATLAAAGVLVIVAASRSQPQKATGLDGALKALGAQPYGTILLTTAALGLVVYGLYSFVMARYTKM